MRVVFFGTPEYILPVLTSLHKTFKSKSGISPIVAVVTQSPKPVGRKKVLTYSPIDKWAHERKIPVFYHCKKLLEENISADLGVLASFGQVIPKEVINLFTHGILNVHPSLLPKYRGSSPARAAIVSGDKETGVTIIKLDEEVDHGLVISQFTEGVQEKDTTETLRKRLFERSAKVLIELLPHYLKGEITPRKQEHDKAVYTTQIKKEHAFIPPEYLAAALAGKTTKERWKIPFIKKYSLFPGPETLDRFVRAMQPWPLAWTRVTFTNTTKRLKILKAHLENGKFILDEIQLEGKNPVSWKQFREGYPKVIFE